MGLIEGFTRKQTEILTGINRDCLAYLAEQKIIVPEKFGGGVRSPLVYSFRQLLLLKQIKEIRRELRLQVIKGMIEFTKSRQGDRLISKGKLAVINNTYQWISPDLSDLPKHFDIQSGQVYSAKLIILPSTFEVLEDITAIAKEHQDIIDFELFKAISDNEIWEEQIEADFLSGKFDQLIKEARKEFSQRKVEV
jgi:DNA-binding transcriptional MerR regulator